MHSLLTLYIPPPSPTMVPNAKACHAYRNYQPLVCPVAATMHGDSMRAWEEFGQNSEAAAWWKRHCQGLDPIFLGLMQSPSVYSTKYNANPPYKLQLAPFPPQHIWSCSRDAVGDQANLWFHVGVTLMVRKIGRYHDKPAKSYPPRGRLLPDRHKNLKKENISGIPGFIGENRPIKPILTKLA